MEKDKAEKLDSNFHVTISSISEYFPAEKNKDLFKKAMPNKEIETLDEMGFWSETEELPTPDSEVRTQRKNYKVKDKKFEVNAITLLKVISMLKFLNG